MVEVPESVSVKEYFDEYVPKIFAEQVGGTGILGMEGTEIALQFDVTNGSTLTYSLLIKDAKELEVKEGAVDNPLIRLEVPEAVWREAVSGKTEGVMDMFTDMSQMTKARFDQIQGVKGSLSLDLSKPDGSIAPVKVVFNGTESPATTFKCAVEDWVALSKGEIAGPTAFMSGKLKIEGDMPFAMSLASLTG
jgi:putative sterol carrier protein